MSASPARIGLRRGDWLALAALALLCAIIYCFGLTTYGLHNWQEGQRALVAREMFREGRWITPTVHGEPYIAKPPLMYWVAISIGHARGWMGWEPFTDESEVRLTVALAATLGVLATYVVARRLLAPDKPEPDEETFARRAAWLSALGLATGLLYFRSARIGELDALIVPFVVVAVGAVDAARRRMRVKGTTHWAALGIAAIAGVGAVLTKGPPALLMIALAGYGPLLLRAVDACARTVASRRAETAGAVVVGIALMALSAPQLNGARALAGLLCMGVMGALLGVWLGRFARPGAFRAAFVALHAGHPIVTLGVPVLAFWWWGHMVTQELGAEVVARLAGQELENNLRVLYLESPVKNLGFFAYGVAPISIAALGAAFWVMRDRPAFDSAPGRWTPFVWAGLAFMAFSLLGKGVARYLLPAWPGVAMMGGLWLATRLREREATASDSRRISALICAGFIAMGAAEAWWYGAGRQVYLQEETPREFVRELIPAVTDGRIGVYEVASPALDFYFDMPVTLWERKPRDPARTVSALIAEAGRGEYLLLARRETPGVIRRYGSILEPLRSAGFTVEEEPTRAVFLRPDEDSVVAAYRITRPDGPERGG